MFEVFTRPSVGNDDSGRLLATDGLILTIAIDETWSQCLLCGHVQLKPFWVPAKIVGGKNLRLVLPIIPI